MRFGVGILMLASILAVSVPAAAKTDPAVREAQQALIREGAKLKADGRMGPGTKAALESYQRSHGLKVTGRLDAETARRLGLRTASDKPAAPAAQRTPGKTVQRESGRVNATKIISKGRPK
jgi:peptidoglycan hydrolase-like protein with peptidoglycan-binding domain